MQSGHLELDLLIAYAEGRAELSDTQLAHVNSCSTCWEDVDFYQNVAPSLTKESVAIESELRGGRGQHLVAAFERRLRAEDAEAEQLLAPIIDSPYAFTRANIIKRRRYHTGGIVRKLIERADRECRRDPEYAFQLIDTARIIAELLPDNYYPAAGIYEWRGTAWKTYSTVCRYLGGTYFKSGFDALDRAERAYRHVLNPAMGLASTKLARAILLEKQERYAEALPLAEAAANEYAAIGQTLKYVDAKEVVAIIFSLMGRIAEALETYKRSYELADSFDDADRKARAAKNIGLAYQELGDLGNSSKYLLIALQTFEALGHDVLVIRTRWHLATLWLKGGKFAEAVSRLSKVYRDLSEKGMRSDAALVKLDLAEAHLMLGELDEVELICAELVMFFRQVNMVTGALTAVAFLKEAVTQRRLLRSDIHHVRHYLEKLVDQSGLPFVPPSSL